MPSTRSGNEFPFVVDPPSLAARVGEPGMVVVDLGHVDAYRRAHVPGAVHLDYARIVAARPPAGGLLPDTADLAALLGAAGIGDDTWVVACDDEGGGRAGRLLWTLDVLGHPAKSLLDGGMRVWTRDGLPVEAGEPARPPAAGFTVRDGRGLASRKTIEARLGDAGFLPLDARSPAEYLGTDRRAERAGHIPGAANFDWNRLKNPDDALALHPLETLRGELEAAGATAERDIVTYCQTHHRSSLLYWVLRTLGYERVAGYPGSWSEWGNTPDTPIAGPEDL